jgi:hypothetical protein
MLLDVAVDLDPDDIPSPARDVTSYVIEVMVYRQGFHDGADGHGPARTAWAYERGYTAGEFFRERISSKSKPMDQHFPGWPSLHNVYVTVSTGGFRQIKFPKRVLAALGGAKRY